MFAFLVSSVVGVCARLLCIAWLENGFVDVVTRIHGHTMFAECLAVRPHSLLLHGPFFHSRCLLRRWDTVLGCYRLGRPGGNGLVT